jgi:hypothetical protein
MGIKCYILNEDCWPKFLDTPDNLISMHNKGVFGYVVENNKTIYADTNKKIDDYHPSYDGHIDIANYVINFINNETTNIYNT